MTTNNIILFPSSLMTAPTHSTEFQSPTRQVSRRVMFPELFGTYDKYRTFLKIGHVTKRTKSLTLNFQRMIEHGHRWNPFFPSYYFHVSEEETAVRVQDQVVVIAKPCTARQNKKVVGHHVQPGWQRLFLMSFTTGKAERKIAVDKKIPSTVAKTILKRGRECNCFRINRRKSKSFLLKK